MTRASTAVSFLVFRAERMSAEKTCGGDILVAVSDSRTDLERAEVVFGFKYLLLKALFYLSATAICV